MGQTPRFGFDYFGGTEVGSIADNGGKFTGRDRRLLDRILSAYEVHEHTGGTRLADPAQLPTLTLATTGGELPSGETYYYRVSYVDQYGLETAAGDEVSVATPAVIAVPDTPGVNAEAGGTLGQGLHQYALTALSATGQETPLSQPAMVTLTDWRSVTVTWTAPADAAQIGVWRQGPLDGGFTKIATIAAATGTYLDDGSVPSSDCPCDPENLPPQDNLTNATNAITIDLPAEAVGNDLIASWRIYRTTVSGVYESSSMVAEVVETADELGGALVTTYTDTGDLPQPGQPLDISQTLQPASTLVLPTGAALPDPAGLPEAYPFLLDDGTLHAILGGAFTAIGGGGGEPGNTASVTLADAAAHTIATYAGAQFLSITLSGTWADLNLPSAVDLSAPIVLVIYGDATDELYLNTQAGEYVWDSSTLYGGQTVVLWPGTDNTDTPMWFDVVVREPITEPPKLLFRSEQATVTDSLGGVGVREVVNAAFDTTVTLPASGSVRVELEAFCAPNASELAAWVLDNGFGTARAVRAIVQGPTTGARHRVSIVLTSTAFSNMRIRWQSESTDFTTDAATYGPAVMEVWEQPAVS